MWGPLPSLCEPLFNYLCYKIDSYKTVIHFQACFQPLPLECDLRKAEREACKLWAEITPE